MTQYLLKLILKYNISQ